MQPTSPSNSIRSRVSRHSHTSQDDTESIIRECNWGDLWKNPIFRDMHEVSQKTTKHLQRALDEIQELKEQAKVAAEREERLHAQLASKPPASSYPNVLPMHALRRQSAAYSSSVHGESSLGPSDSISRQNSTESLSAFEEVQMPSDRPEEYPATILWAQKDCKDYGPPGVLTDSNPGRPIMKLAIRTLEGNDISDNTYTAIMASAKMIKHELLRLPATPELLQETSGKIKNRHFFETYYPIQWAKARAKLERLQPLVSYCAAHWKADHVLATVLRSAAKKQDIYEAPPRLPPTSKPTSQHSRSSNGKKRQRDQLSPQKSQRSKKLRNTHTNDISGNNNPQQLESTLVSSSGSQVPPSSSVQQTTATSPSSTTSSHGPDYFIDPALAIPPKAAVLFLPPAPPPKPRPRALSFSLFINNGNAPPTSSAKTTVDLDISFIKVVPTFDVLIEIFKDEYPSAVAVDTLKAMQDRPDFKSALPSPDVIAFLSRIETADPNAGTFTEDDLGAGWGHYQFTGGSMSYSMALTSWESIGNTLTACRIIAAAVKTCRVARQICHLQKIPASNLMSDIYLDKVVSLISKFWDAAGGNDIAEPETPPKTPAPLGSTNIDTVTTSNTSVPAAPANSDALAKSLSNLLKGRLQSLAISCGLTVSHLSKKEELIGAILAAPQDKRPTLQAVRDLLRAHRNDKASKAKAV